MGHTVSTHSVPCVTAFLSLNWWATERVWDPGRLPRTAGSQTTWVWGRPHPPAGLVCSFLPAISEHLLWLPQGELQPVCAEGHTEEDAEVLRAAADGGARPEHHRDHAEATLWQPRRGQLQLLPPQAQVGQEPDHIQVPRLGSWKQGTGAAGH